MEHLMSNRLAQWFAPLTAAAVALWFLVGAYEPAALLSFNNLSEITSQSTARTNLGLGSAAVLTSAQVFQVSNNLSEGTAATMRSNLALGTIATQAASAVAITGGTITGTTFDSGAIGATTPSTIKGTTGNFSGILTTGSGSVHNVRVITATGAITIATTDDYVVINKTTGAASAVALYATPTTGSMFCIKDGKGDANANPITITPAAGNIDGAATFVMNQNYQANCFIYNATQWNVL
jgi:hypothetical protein